LELTFVGSHRNSYKTGNIREYFNVDGENDPDLSQRLIKPVAITSLERTVR
jgi:hypothetical protein